MIIPKAIELLEDYYKKLPRGVNNDYIDANKLGTEALKRIEYVRIHPWSEIYAPLPGETMPEWT